MRVFSVQTGKTGMGVGAAPPTMPGCKLRYPFGADTGAMFVVTGDETGLVKLVDVKNRTYIRYGENQSRADGVCSVQSMSKESVLTLNLKGSVEVYSVDSATEGVCMHPRSCVPAAVSKPTGMIKIISNRMYDGRVLIYNAEGAVSIQRPASGSAANGANFAVKGPVAAACGCDGAGALFGGRENDTRFYDLATQQEKWAAKNVSQDKLHLRVPVWVTCLAFRDGINSSFDDSNSAADSGASTVFYTGTAHRHVRMYDMQASRQPVASFEIGTDFRVASICPAAGSEGERLLYVADTAGGLVQWDLRTQRRLATLKGAAGSIRSMTISPDGRHLACVGLDRFLRVYSTATHQLESAIYLKNRLSTCAFLEGQRVEQRKDQSAPKKARSAGGRAGGRVRNEADEDELRELRDSDSDEGGEEGEEGESSDSDEGGEEGDGSVDDSDSAEEEDEAEGDFEGSGEEGSDGDSAEDSDDEEDSNEEEEEDGEDSDEEEDDSDDEEEDDSDDEEEAPAPVKGRPAPRAPAPKKVRR